jgi:hypothetical protein
MRLWQEFGLSPSLALSDVIGMLPRDSAMPWTFHKQTGTD